MPPVLGRIRSGGMLMAWLDPSESGFSRWGLDFKRKGGIPRIIGEFSKGGMPAIEGARNQHHPRCRSRRPMKRFDRLSHFPRLRLSSKANLRGWAHRGGAMAKGTTSYLTTPFCFYKLRCAVGHCPTLRFNATAGWKGGPFRERPPRRGLESPDSQFQGCRLRSRTAERGGYGAVV